MGTLVSHSLLEARERKSDADTPRDKGGQVTGNCGNCGKPDLKPERERVIMTHRETRVVR